MPHKMMQAMLCTAVGIFLILIGAFFIWSDYTRAAHPGSANGFGCLGALIGIAGLVFCFLGCASLDDPPSKPRT